MEPRIIFKYLILIVLLAFFLSANMLELMGISYVSIGGSSLLKIHIYSYLTILLFCYFTFKLGFSRFVSLLNGEKRYWLYCLLSLCIVIGYGLIKQGTAGLAYLIDSLLAALLIFPLLALIPHDLKEKIVVILAYLLLLNSLTAILEMTFHRDLVRLSVEYSQYFRATAFLNHSLNNALITASLAPLLWDKTKLSPILYVAIILLALFAFGGRAAMAVFMFGLVVVCCKYTINYVSVGIRMDWNKFAFINFLIPVSAIVLCVVLLESNIANRILTHLYIDRSAEARLDVFILLDQLSVNEWFFGVNQSFFENINSLIGINVVENYIIGWILNFGIIGCLLLLVATFLLSVKYALTGDIMAIISVMSFVAISVCNNALTAKTPALMFLFLALACARRDNVPI